MQHIIDALTTEHELPNWYCLALDRWREILGAIDPRDSKAIAKKAQVEQVWFEDNCGGRSLGQEIMVVAGITQYCRARDGFADRIDRARAMYHGLLESRCSVEVHAAAHTVARLYPDLSELPANEV